VSFLSPIQSRGIEKGDRPLFSLGEGEKEMSGRASSVSPEADQKRTLREKRGKSTLFIGRGGFKEGEGGSEYILRSRKYFPIEVTEEGTLHSSFRTKKRGRVWREENRKPALLIYFEARREASLKLRLGKRRGGGKMFLPRLNRERKRKGERKKKRLRTALRKLVLFRRVHIVFIQQVEGEGLVSKYHFPRRRGKEREMRRSRLICLPCSAGRKVEESSMLCQSQKIKGFRASFAITCWRWGGKERGWLHRYLLSLRLRGGSLALPADCRRSSL